MTNERLARLDPAHYGLPAADLARLQTPALAIHLDRVRANVERMAAWLGGDLDRWRPHVKTAKIPEVFRLLARRGVRRFKCATTREAFHLMQAFEEEQIRGADVLIAYAHAGPALQRLTMLAERFPETRLSVLAEDPSAAAAVPARLGVFVDVNPGMDRTGIPMSERDSIGAVARAAGPRFRGVHFYEGHIRDADGRIRGHRSAGLFEELVTIVRSLQAGGLVVEEVVTSGTPTFRAALAFPALRDLAEARHRVSPGTVVYHDAASDAFEELDLEPAAVVLSRVVSHPGPRLVTCDAGSKSLAAEAGDPCAIVPGRPGLVARRPSEEHLPFDVAAGERPARGEVLSLIPRHVCPTVNLAEEALLVDGGRIVMTVPVAARAHETWT